MDKYNNNLALLGEILDMDCSHMTTEDMRKILNAELDKPADMINSKLIHVLLDILEPTPTVTAQADMSFSELADIIESDIAMRTFVNSGGEPYHFDTVCDDIAFLMVEQYEKSGRSNPNEIQLIRDTAKKGEAALFIVIATLFQNTLDDAILGAVEGACDYLLVADDLIAGMTGEDLEIQAGLASLHMNSIHQLIRYAEMGECNILSLLREKASEAQIMADHIAATYLRKITQ